MQFPALRRGGALLLLLLMACPTMTVAAPPAPTGAPIRSTVASPSDARRPTRQTAVRRAHRMRRPPGGVVYARNAILLDPITDSVLYQKNAETPAPIASLTKLMTALVFLEQNPDLRRSMEVTPADLHGAGHTQLRTHETVPLYDLIHMSLMCSDNAATRMLVRASDLELDEFIDRMNRKAHELGLEHTHYVEVTGLDQGNVSTAADIAQLLRVAADNTLIRDITTTTSYRFAAARTTRRGLVRHQIANTNRLLHSRSIEVNCGKTGFIIEAGYCLATWVHARGHDLIAVVLGAPTNATRFADVVRLVQYTAPPSATTPHS
jgi:D-alanyl-D-alanine endopeptidase (penicillin-binding protein 7)